MSVALKPVVTDHELYRVFQFLTWETLEPNEATARRLRTLQGELHRLGWMPGDSRLPERSQMADWKQRLWDEPPAPLEDGWFKKLHGIAYPEELLVYVGLWRQEERTEENWEDWIRSAAEEWEKRFPDWRRTVTFAFPEMIEHGDRPRVLGQAWVWTGEWDVEPSEGWETFGRSAYGPGRFRLFDWGVLGFPDDPEVRPGGLPRFDLHTTTEPGPKHGRSAHLLWELPRLLTSFLKADQFLRHRYQGALRPALDSARAELLDRARQSDRPESDSGSDTTMRRTQRRVEDITHQLYDLTSVLTALKVDTRSVDLALHEVRGCLPTSGGPEPWLVATLGLLEREMRASLDYGHMTETVGARLLEKHSIFAELEETRATERLTILGMIIGAAVSSLQLTTKVTIRWGIFVAAVLLCLLVYRWDNIQGAWKRFKPRIFGP
jgi:hypothetical protein